MIESEILATIRAQEKATEKGDAQGIVDSMSADVSVFDLPPLSSIKAKQPATSES